MNRVRSLVVASLLMVALVGAAAAGTSADQPNAASAVDQHMQMLTTKLDLTADQQAKIKPILQQMIDGRQKLMEDKKLSAEERHQKMHALREQASREARQYLTDEQKQKLEQMEQEHMQHEHN